MKLSPSFEKFIAERAMRWPSIGFLKFMIDKKEEESRKRARITEWYKTRTSADSSERN